MDTRRLEEQIELLLDSTAELRAAVRAETNEIEKARLAQLLDAHEQDLAATRELLAAQKRPADET